MEPKNTAKIYNSLINFLLNRKFDEISVKNYEYLNERVYRNLESSFLEYVSQEQYFDQGLFEDLLLNDIHSKWSKKENEISEGEIKEVLVKIKEAFQLNKAEHFILIPLPKLKLEEIISTDKISIIPRKISEDEKVAHISMITGINLEKVSESLNHTKLSRSPDFLTHAILVFHHTGQTEYIRYNSSSIAKGIVFLLRAYYYGEIYEVDEYLSDDIDIFNIYNYEQNHHIVILSKDNWRQGHSPISYSTECSFSADFLHNPDHMKNFLILIDQLVLTKRSVKSMRSLFYGSLLTFNKSLDLISERKSQSESLGILLMITTAETLLAQENHGNRMKVRVLLPRFVGSQECLKRTDIVLSLETLYKMRNDYAHAGKESYIHESEDELNYYNVAKKSLGKLICMYPKLSLEKDEAKWSDFLKEKFNAGIDGEF